ncbi:MAG: ABC transporter ATP-binding protein [Candidatus Cryosericum sp.]
MNEDNVLMRIDGVTTNFHTYAGIVHAVDDMTLTVPKDSVVGIVGESGSGKSVTMMSVMRLIPVPPGRIESGHVWFDGAALDMPDRVEKDGPNKGMVDLLSLPADAMMKVRGRHIGMIFQDPMVSLNPVLTIGLQMTESMVAHGLATNEEAWKRAIDMLALVGIPNPEERMRDYPHQYSGGMRQRVMIAMALSCSPELVIADEPTTSLDVTVQAQILELMKELKGKLKSSIIIISHDLSIVAGIADKVVVMYAGRMLEEANVYDLYEHPGHPYTMGLMKSVPRLDAENRERLIPIEGSPPDLLSPPVGCKFAPRCKYAMKICREQEPPLITIGDGHRARCFLHHPTAPAVPGFVKVG